MKKKLNPEKRVRRGKHIGVKRDGVKKLGAAELVRLCLEGKLGAHDDGTMYLLATGETVA